ENEWYKIKYNGSYGYVHSDYVSIEGNGENNEENNEDVEEDNTFNELGYVYNLGGTNLRVRQSPSSNSEILGSLYDGNEVNIIGEVNGWYKIKYNNSVAYVSSEYITLDNSSDSGTTQEPMPEPETPPETTQPTTPSNPEDVVINRGQVINVEGSNLRVRQSPSTDSLVAGYLLNNETVNIVGEESNWYKIKFNNSVGYVSCDYVRVTGNDSSAGDSNTGGSSTGGNISDEADQQNTYNTIYNAMMAQVGSPYVWGGYGEALTTANLNVLKNRFPADTAAGEYVDAERFVDQGYRAFDCSGLMQWSFAQAGINIGRTTYDQINNGIEVSLYDVEVGDLIFTDDIGHVGMYIGNDQWIEAPYNSEYIRVKNVPWNYVSRARRIL
ncbi:MAG: SH3 domain-containing protein, partial [Clostridium sp.]